jgi:hypothetical protein
MTVRGKGVQVIAAALAASLVACADMPRDPERTEALVRESKTIRLGVVAGTRSEPRAARAVARLEQVVGARAEPKEADSEMLLRELEEGKIDLVYGSFAMDSPWATRVHLGKALDWRAEPPKHVATPRFAYRNGENGWIMRVEIAALEAKAP